MLHGNEGRQGAVYAHGQGRALCPRSDPGHSQPHGSTCRTPFQKRTATLSPTSPTSATSRLTKRRLANLSSILMIHSSSERVGITCMRISLEGYMSRVPPMNCVGGGVSAPLVTPCLMQWIVDCIKSLSLRTLYAMGAVLTTTRLTTDRLPIAASRDVPSRSRTQYHTPHARCSPSAALRRFPILAMAGRSEAI